MAELVMLDKMYHTTMQYFINTGQAPYYTELATDLGLTMEEGKRLLHELIGRAGVMSPSGSSSMTNVGGPWHESTPTSGCRCHASRSRC